MSSLQLLLLFACCIAFVQTLNTYTHDESFIPDAILRVSAQNISIGGIQRYTTLVNGSAPGPELCIPEGEHVWVRVYNDLTDQNATMVSTCGHKIPLEAYV